MYSSLVDWVLFYFILFWRWDLSKSLEHLCDPEIGTLQANTEEELPEKLLGTVRISNLEMQKAVLPPPES